MKLLHLFEAIDLMYNKLPSGMDIEIYYAGSEEKSIIILDKNENRDILPDSAILIAGDPISFIFYVERAIHRAYLERQKYIHDKLKDSSN